MLKMPKEFGTAEQLLAHLPRTMAQHEELANMVMRLRAADNASLTLVMSSLQLMNLNLAAQLEWALAAIDELQIEVAMLRGDGKR